VYTLSRLGIMLFWLIRFFSNRAYHVRAFEEVFVVSVVSIVPLGLLPFIESLRIGAQAPFDLENTIWAAISSGQLFLYSFAMLGMIIWLSVEDVSSKPFAPRKYFIVVALLAAFLCLLVYESDPALSRPLNPLIVKVSICIYCGYLAMYYALLVFKMLRAPPLGETVDSEVESLIHKSRQHGGGKS
jgi:hypothetical protein